MRALLVILLPILVFKALDVPHAETSAVFCTAVVLWFTELLPLAATGLLVPVLAGLYGVLPVKDVFLPFGNQIIFLFIGAFILAEAMRKHGLDQRIAFLVLSTKLGSRSIEAVITTIGVTSWVLSMWVSNTATCAIMAPICLGVIRALEDKVAEEGLKTRMLLTCGFASTIGGLGTPVGSPPNLLAMDFLADRGVELSFLDWMLYGVPLTTVMLLALFVIMHFRFPLHALPGVDLRSYFQHRLASCGKVQKGELHVFFCFACAVLLWVAPGLLGLAGIEFDVISMGGVAVLAAVALIALGTISWPEASKIDWGTVLLFGGGLCLGEVLDTSGLAQTLGEFAFSGVGDSLLLLLLIVVALSILTSEFGSNTASAAIIIPVVLTVPNIPLEIALCSAFGASFGFMLPVSTPPNAIIYGTGLLKLKDMISTGAIFDLLALGVVVLYSYFFVL